MKKPAIKAWGCERCFLWLPSFTFPCFRLPFLTFGYFSLPFLAFPYLSLFCICLTNRLSDRLTDEHTLQLIGLLSQPKTILLEFYFYFWLARKEPCNAIILLRLEKLVAVLQSAPLASVCQVRGPGSSGACSSHCSVLRPTATLQLRLGLALSEATEVTPILPSYSSPTAGWWWPDTETFFRDEASDGDYPDNGMIFGPLSLCSGRTIPGSTTLITTSTNGNTR